MDLQISGETALLLSSTRGLGYGCATALINEGVNVIMNGTNKERGIKAAMDLGPNAYFIQADITKSNEREYLFSEAKKISSNISILVTNADGPIPGKFIDKSIEDWNEAIMLVLLPAIDIAKKIIPGMINNGYGRIINISSTSAKETISGSIFANSLKPALIGSFNTLAKEVADTGVTINSILPGSFQTDRIINYAKNTYNTDNIDNAIKIYSQNLPMKRIGQLEEIGALCAFLCSKKSGYITGQSIVIDGGLVSSFL